MRRIGVLMAQRRGRSGRTGPPRGIPAGAAAIGLDRRPQRADRHTLGCGRCRRPRKYAAELVALAPDVILAAGSASVAALQQTTRTVPIVFAIVIDPVGAGFVASLSRPGGNATGFSAFEYSLSGKWLELLKEIAPNLTRVAVLRDPALAAGIGQFAAIQAMAPPSFGVEVSSDRRARRRRDRARSRCIRAQREWRPDRDGERVGGGPSRSDHRACGSVQIARGLLRSATSSPAAA